MPMKIFDHYKHISLTTDQCRTLELLSDFLQSNKHIFILNGYAGTGKTTLLKGLINYLKSEQMNVEVMAPTGRAAKILKDKTGQGVTIHRAIYNLDKLERVEKEDDEYNFHYYFPLRNLNALKNILIVDEASMISSKKSNHELFTFGTNILLDDLLTYSKIPESSTKMIFVGDPAQLPPVGDNESYALNAEHLKEKGFKVESVMLTDVVRQDNNSILSNALALRDAINNQPVREFKFQYDSGTFLNVNSEQIPDLYVKEFTTPQLKNGVVIAYSNLACLHYNTAIRKNYFGENISVTVGDILLITHNHYNNNPELLNGDMIQVTEASDTIIERKNIPVFVTENGKRIKKHVTLTFREIKYRLHEHDIENRALILDNMLYSKDPDINLLEMKALFVEFVMRFKEQQMRNKENRLPYYDIKSEQFAEQLKTDRFYNALRVKFGYAITCHKAQGGEWSKVMVDYHGRNGVRKDPLRWAYTATTRSIETCYAANAPYLSAFGKLQLSEIGSIGNTPDNAVDFTNVPLSPFHTVSQHLCKSAKYWEVLEKLENSAYQITQVNTLSEYQERYQISCDDEVDTFDVHHNAGGIFNPFKPLNTNRYAWQPYLLTALNNPYPFSYNIAYKPENNTLIDLYMLMQTLCSESDIQITNVEERMLQYYVIYFLHTDEKCAYIQFYFNKVGQLTRAMPKSTSGSADIKLNHLLAKLKEYAV
jgi:tRNA A37 threonylcarbamoyladenosine biosynthesis protein TsaE